MLEGKSRLIVLLGVIFASPGCFGASIEGSLVSRGQPTGDWTMVPETCLSGQPEEFLGVYLGDDDDERQVVKLVKDPLRGLVARISIPSTCNAQGTCSALEIDSTSGCEIFEGDVERDMSISTNRIYHVSGALHVTCHFKTGGVLEGDLRFSGCH